jgi:hypothetical protein
MLFFTRVRHGVCSSGGKSAPLVAVIALKPDVLLRVGLLLVLQEECAAFSLVPALVWLYSLEACTLLQLLLQLRRMILLPVLQVRLGCLLWGAEAADVAGVAGGGVVDVGLDEVFAIVHAGALLCGGVVEVSFGSCPDGTIMRNIY